MRLSSHLNFFLNVRVDCKPVSDIQNYSLQVQSRSYIDDELLLQKNEEKIMIMNFNVKRGSN